MSVNIWHHWILCPMYVAILFYHFCARCSAKVYNSEGLFVRSFRVRADKAFVRLCKTLSEHPFGVLKCVRDGVLFDEGY